MSHRIENLWIGTRIYFPFGIWGQKFSISFPSRVMTKSLRSSKKEFERKKKFFSYLFNSLWKDARSCWRRQFCRADSVLQNVLFGCFFISRRGILIFVFLTLHLGENSRKTRFCKKRHFLKKLLFRKTKFEIPSLQIKKI